MREDTIKRDNPPSPQWEQPPLDEELDEFDGHAVRLGITKEALVEAFGRGHLQELSDADWQAMENCDSAGQNWTVEEIEAHRGSERDVFGITSAFREGKRMYAPVVLFRKNERPFLIGGNTRLMLCRAFGVRPTIWAMHL